MTTLPDPATTPTIPVEVTAKLLGIGKTTLYRKLKEYGLSDDQSLT